MKSAPLSITLVPRGGLANRMRAVASAVALAHAAGAHLEVVWMATSDLCALFSDLFLTDGLPFTLTEYSGRKFSYLPHRAKYLFLPTLLQRLRYSNTLRDESAADNPLLISYSRERVDDYFRRHACGQVYIDTCYQFYDFDPHCYSELFRPSAEVEKRVHELLSDDSEGYIAPTGIHIRRTDHVKSIANSPLELFEKEIAERLESDPRQIFYLATDDDATKERLTNMFPGRILTSCFTASRASRSGMIEGAAEMFVLSRCSGIIGSFNSSFSKAASMIGDISLEILSL